MHTKHLQLDHCTDRTCSFSLWKSESLVSLGLQLNVGIEISRTKVQENDTFAPKRSVVLHEWEKAEKFLSFVNLALFQYQICKRKLDSKCEALLILTQDLDQCRGERDQFKLMAEQVQERYQALKRQLAGVVCTGGEGVFFFSGRGCGG